MFLEIVNEEGFQQSTDEKILEVYEIVQLAQSLEGGEDAGTDNLMGLFKCDVDGHDFNN